MPYQYNRKHASLIDAAIERWQAEGLLETETAARLKASYQAVPFDWGRLAKYAFWAALACTLIAVGSVFSDRLLMELLAQLFNAPESVKALFFTVLAAMFYSWGSQRRQRMPGKRYSNEAVFFLGIVSTAAAVAFLGRALDTGSGHYSLLLALAAVVYGVLGLWFPSGLVWVFALLSLGSWFGAETGYMSGWGAYYLGMNYPLRFVAFGIALIAAGTAFGGWPARRAFLRPTRAMGLLYLFIALWIMSIFGNYGDINVWYHVKQIELFHWSLLFAIASGAAIWHGLKYDDGMTRGFGLVFLFINLYTRFFEYFWNSLHKAVFFALLAASLWYIGSHAERIWSLGRAPVPERA